jgi:hypothetical protein
LLVVLEVGHHDLVQNLVVDRRVLDGDQRLDAAQQIQESRKEANYKEAA